MSEAAEQVTRLLEEYAQLAQRAGAPAISAMRPGKSPTVLQSEVERNGLALPPEVLALFSWHDGAESLSSGDGRRRDALMGAWRFVPFGELVEWHDNVWTELKGELNSATFGSPENDPWLGWFPLFLGLDSTTAVLINCAVPPGSPSTCAMWDLDTPEPAGAVRQMSLVSLLDTWCGWLRGSHIQWDSEIVAWTLGPNLLHWTTYRMAFI